MSSFESGTPLDKARADEGLTSFDQKVAGALEKPVVQILLLNAFKEYMVQYLALNQPPLSISQVFGFEQFTAQSATPVLTEETTASVTYTDLATAGPTLTGLPDGQYVIFFGSSVDNSDAAGASIVSVQINATGASDDDRTGGTGTVAVNATRGVVKTLNAGGNNSITMKYRVGAGTGTFGLRWMFALRSGNA